jgi:hypothetical protein
MDFSTGYLQLCAIDELHDIPNSTLLLTTSPQEVTAALYAISAEPHARPHEGQIPLPTPFCQNGP